LRNVCFKFYNRDIILEHSLLRYSFVILASWIFQNSPGNEGRWGQKNCSNFGFHTIQRDSRKKCLCKISDPTSRATRDVEVDRCRYLWLNSSVSNQLRDLRPEPNERKFYPFFKNVQKEAKVNLMIAQIWKEVGGA
jgi:hypothetical protein